jgi:uncharacterized glyoxalase superfamily protein PhnB
MRTTRRWIDGRKSARRPFAAGLIFVAGPPEEIPMSKSGGSAMIPSMRYRDPHAAIAWLCRAFGFTKNAVYENDLGGVEHAQLVHGNGMIMLGGVRHDDFGQHIAQPDEIGGRETQCAYVIVADCKAHYVQARAAGAVIVNDY